MPVPMSVLLLQMAFGMGTAVWSMIIPIVVGWHVSTGLAQKELNVTWGSNNWAVARCADIARCPISYECKAAYTRCVYLSTHGQPMCLDCSG